MKIKFFDFVEEVKGEVIKKVFISFKRVVDRIDQEIVRKAKPEDFENYKKQFEKYQEEVKAIKEDVKSLAKDIEETAKEIKEDVSEIADEVKTSKKGGKK